MRLATAVLFLLVAIGPAHAALVDYSYTVTGEYEIFALFDLPGCFEGDCGSGEVTETGLLTYDTDTGEFFGLEFLGLPFSGHPDGTLDAGASPAPLLPFPDPSTDVRPSDLGVIGLWSFDGDGSIVGDFSGGALCISCAEYLWSVRGSFVATRIVVPEPGTVAMLAIGLAALCFGVRPRGSGQT
jgi:hypothetical protein